MKLYNLSKCIFDFIVSLIVAVTLLPVFLIIIIVIRLQSKGPAIFKQTRAGKNAKPFTLYKFRTMKTNTDPFGASPKSDSDDRLTKVGKFLREYSLDELPQLFNILKGDMSIVGPRPLYVAQIEEWDDRQKRRLLVKPGLTGLAQISGRGALTREDKLELDVRYVENVSFFADVKIIFSTFLQIFRKPDIYEKKYSRTEETRGQNTE